MKTSELSHPDKILFQEANISKLMLAHYYKKISNYILPHIKNRPLTFVRCPASNDSACFYQKHWMEGMPSGIEIANIPDKEESESEYMIINQQSGLIAAAQLAVLEIHPWSSRFDKLNQPDRLIFDLDPSPEVTWQNLIEAGIIVRDSLAALNFKSFIKLTGGKGIHIVAPITRKKTYPEIKMFCKLFSEQLAKHFPNLLTAEISKKKRTNKIFIDYLRNEYEATAIAPFSPRSNANIAVPIDWDKLLKTKSSKEYSIHTIQKYFADYPESPWPDFFTHKQSVTDKHLQALKNI